MKNALPLLAIIALGGLLLHTGRHDEEEEEDNEKIPTSLDYRDPALKDALEQAEDPAEEEEEERDEQE